METGNESQTAPPSFGIENTTEIGAGNTELLKDLLSPETSTGNPEDVEPIEEEDPKGKPEGEAATEGEGGEQKPKPEPEGDELISSFLEGEEGEEVSKIPKPEGEPKGEGEDEEGKPKGEEGKERKEGEDEGEGEEGEEGEDDGSKFSALTKDLFKLGVFTPDEDEDAENVEIKNPEDFLERFNSEKKKGAIDIVNNFIGQFGEDYQQAFDSIFVKGVNPKEYFNTFNQIEDYSKLDLSEESNQERVVKTALAEQGFEPEDVETEVERLKNYGDLEAVATKYNKVLVKKQAAKMKEMEEHAQQEQERKAAFKNQYIQNVQSTLQEKLKEKEFDGIPLNPKLANELQDYLLVDKYKTASGETLTDFDRTILELKKPENHPTKVKVALLLKILEKDPNLSTIQKSGVTKKSNELFGEVARQVTKTKKKDNSNRQETNKTNKWFL